MRPDAATLRLAFFPRTRLLTDVLLVLGGAAFVALAAQVSIGLPFTPVPITDGNHGWDVLTGPTGGYIVGFVLAAVLTGWLAERRWDRRFSSAVAAMLSGNVVIYLVGLPWLSVKLDTGLEKTFELGLYPFVVGDLLKLYLAGALLPGAWRLVQRFKG